MIMLSKHPNPHKAKLIKRCVLGVTPQHLRRQALVLAYPCTPQSGTRYRARLRQHAGRMCRFGQADLRMLCCLIEPRAISKCFELLRSNRLCSKTETAFGQAVFRVLCSCCTAFRDVVSGYLIPCGALNSSVKSDERTSFKYNGPVFSPKHVPSFGRVKSA